MVVQDLILYLLGSLQLELVQVAMLQVVVVVELTKQILVMDLAVQVAVVEQVIGMEPHKFNLLQELPIQVAVVAVVALVT